MQIIQHTLGNNISPLGIISSLSNAQRLVLRKESDFLPLRSHIISPIQTKSPLVTSSEFFLSREEEPSINPFISDDSWDNQDIEFDFFDSTDSEDNNNLNNQEVVKPNIPEILPTIIENNPIQDTSPEINLKSKSKSKTKQTNKSQQTPKSKSRSKKSVKSSATKNVVQASDESNLNIHPKLMPSEEPLSNEVHSEIPILQQDFALDNTTNNNDYVSNITPNITASTLPNLEEEPSLFRKVGKEEQQVTSDLLSDAHDSINSITPSITASTLPNLEEEPSLFRKVAKKEQQVISDLPSDLTSVEPSIQKKISPLQQKTKLDENTSELADNSPPNVEETFTPSSKFSKNEQQVINEASQPVDISDFSRYVEKPTRNLTPQPPSLQGKGENSKPLKKQERGLERGFPEPVKSVEKPTRNLTPQPPSLQGKGENSKPLKKQEKGLERGFPEPVKSQVDISDIPLNQTPLQQDIETSQFPAEVQNQSTASLTNLISKKELLPTSKPPSQKEESPNTNNIFEAITASEPDLILESNASDLDIGNTVASNSLENAPLSSAVTSPSLESTASNLDTGNTVASNFIENAPLSSAVTSPSVENTVGAHSYPPLPPVAVTNPESSVIKNPIPVQREIDSSITSESLVSAPVQLTPSSGNIEDKLSFISNSDNNEQLVTSQSQSAVGVNVSDVSANLTSLQRDSSLENIISESTESQAILVPPETVETPTVSATSPEIVEAPKLSNISREIVEAPVVSNISPEIAEAPKLSTTSPEIAETPTLSATSPEVVEAPKLSATSPEIVEAPKLSATSPEIVEAPVVSNISPEITEAPKLSDISSKSNVAETSSIFPKIVENEQRVESELLGAIANSENSEISTFINTSNNQDIPEKPTFPQNQVSTPPQVEQNNSTKNFAAPKGYATGGHITDSQIQNTQQIAPSDTVPAMLTPGEFVINTRDAQKNLPLLQHINTGGTPHDIILPSLEIPNPKEPEQTTSPQTSTKVDSFSDTSLQLKSFDNESPQKSNSLIPSSLGLNVEKQKLSRLNSPQLSSVENKTTDAGETSPQYSSPPMIFRKANSTTNTPSQWADTPSQWSSVEELLNGNDDKFTSFFSGGESKKQNSEFSPVSQSSSESSQIFAKHLSAPRGFANGGEVTSENTESVTETVENTSAKNEEDNKDDTADLEALAREIYSRLRQRLEIEQERQGGYSGRFSW